MLAFFVWSSFEARKKASNRVIDWLPQGTKELEVFLHRYQQHFVEGEYIMVSWKGGYIDDERLDIVAEILTAPLDDGSPPYFARTMTTWSVIEELTDLPAQLSTEAAKNRLAGWLIGQDRRVACLVTVLDLRGWLYPADAIEFLFATIEQVTGLPRSDIYVAGPSIDSVAIDEIAARSQQTLLPLFLLLSLFLLFCCLRHYFAAFIVFWVAIINEELAGTLLFWSGAHVDSVSLLTSALVYVLTISGGVHLINYYRKTLIEMKPGEEHNAPMQTFHKAILPCSLAAFTTILGIGSLAISQMVPIRTFGIFASLTLFLGTVWFFLFILSVLQERPIWKWLPGTIHCPFSHDGSHKNPLSLWERVRVRVTCLFAGSPPHPSPLPEGEGTVNETPKTHSWERFGLLVFYWRFPITTLTFLSLLIFAFGIKDLRTSVSFHGLLPQDAKVLQDYRMLEDKIGGLIPIEVVVHFPDENGENKRMLDQLYFVASLVGELRQTDNVDATISVLNFLPRLPEQYSGGRAVSQRAMMDSMLNRSQDQLRELRFFNTVESGNTDAGYYWRISLRVSAQKRLNYAVLITDVQERLETVRQRRADMDVENVRFDVTGGVPLVFRAQEMLLWDLIYSFMMAFCLIAITMMIVLRGVVRGLLAMIPNLFPCVVVFGFLGLCGIPINMGSMMTASVALGISLDGTLHLLTWVNAGLRRGMNRKDAVIYAIQRCSTALFQTMIICGVGMLVFGLSEFVPVAQFSIMLCVLLMISLAGAIIVLPAILFSPLGRFFESSEKDKGKAWIL